LNLKSKKNFLKSLQIIKKSYLHKLKDKFDIAIKPEVAIPSEYQAIIFLNFGLF
jgi:hypothetical protein